MQTFLSLLPWIIVAVVILIILVRSLYVVQQSRAFVIERLGVFSTVWEEGLHVKIPFVEKIVVHAPDKSSGHRTQQIDIHYNFIGEIGFSHTVHKRESA